jgi:hypothetical protein
MKKAEYYGNALKDIKKELSHQTHVVSGLKDIYKQLESQGYKPLDPLDSVIKDWESRRGYIKGTIKRLEELVTKPR